MFLTYHYIGWATKLFIVDHMWPLVHDFDMLALKCL